jgi:hypothetical protein
VGGDILFVADLFAIIGFYKALGIENLIVSEPVIFLLTKIVLSLIAVAVPIVGLFFLKGFNSDIERYREELVDGVLTKLTPTFREHDKLFREKDFLKNKIKMRICSNRNISKLVKGTLRYSMQCSG